MFVDATSGEVVVSRKDWEKWYDAAYTGKPQVPPHYAHLVAKWNGIPKMMVDRLRIPNFVKDDAISEGMKSLCELAIKYNPRRGAFSTVAYMKVWRDLYRWSEREYKATHMVHSQVSREESGWSAGPSDGERFLDDMVLVDKRKPFTKTVEEAESRSVALKLLKISRREDILRMRFGIGCPEHTLTEIGAKMGFSKERARHLVDDGLSGIVRSINGRTAFDRQREAKRKLAAKRNPPGVRKRRPGEMTDEEMERAAVLLRQGMSYKGVGRALKRNDETIRNAVKDGRIKFKKTSKAG